MDTVLVGRDRELAQLRRRLADAVGGRGGVQLVAGEPGIGKSTLVGAFAAEAAVRGVPVLRGRAVADEGAPELWSWRRMFAAEGLEFPDVGVGPDPAATRFQVIEQATRTMRTAALCDGMVRRPRRSALGRRGLADPVAALTALSAAAASQIS